MRDVFEEYAEEYVKPQKILTAIETARYFNMPEEETLELIIKNSTFLRMKLWSICRKNQHSSCADIMAKIKK